MNNQHLGVFYGTNLMKSIVRFLTILLFAHVAFSESTIQNNLATFQKTWQCKGCDLNSVDLSNFSSIQTPQRKDSPENCSQDLSLSQADLSHAVLEKANFSACIRGMTTTFRSIDFSNANLAHAQLTDSVFYGVFFVYSNLAETKLTRAKLDLSDFTQANFSHAHLDQAQSKPDAMHGWGSNFYLANFCSADLTQANLYGYFQGANFSMAKLNNAVLSTSNDTIPPNILYLQKLTGPGLWIGTNFKDADLTGAHFYDGDNKPADLSQAVFCRTIMPDGRINNRDCR